MIILCLLLFLLCLLLFVCFLPTKDLIKLSFFPIFTDIVTLDYKTLLLLLVKKDDEEFVLGVDVEFCFLCDAIRVCF